jgi:hypothetical protein
MQIIRQVEHCALCFNPDNGKEVLHYWIDNAQDVSELFDEIDAQQLIDISDQEFLLECKSMFE